MYVSAFRIEYGSNVIISQPVYEDLYIAGGNVTINAPVYGDLIIAGGTVIVNDSVANDVLLVAGSAVINGLVGDDVRCIGGTVRISKNVTGDVVVTGGEVIIDSNVIIGGLLASSGNIAVNGNVSNEVRGAFGNLLLNGDVGKNIDCRGNYIKINGHIGGKSILAAKDISIGSGAVFSDGIRFWNRSGVLALSNTQKNGKVVYDESLRIDSPEWYYLGTATLLGLLWYLGMALLMIFVIQYLFSSTMQKSADKIFDSPLGSLGFGFLFFIVTPVVAILTFITVIGIPLGILILLSYIVLVLLAMLTSSVVTANWLNNRFNKGWNNWHLVFAAWGVFVVLEFLSLIPFVGWLVLAIVVCMAYGGILLTIKLKGNRKQIINS
jgi:hypothetical protein